MQEDDVDICASPDLDLNSGKPVFEDVDEFRDIQDNDLLDNYDDWGFKPMDYGLGFTIVYICVDMHK